MLPTLTEKHRQQLNLLLEEIYYSDLPVAEKVRQTMRAAKQTLGVIERIIEANGFKDPDEEIEYFKRSLPQVLAMKLYYQELYLIDEQLPVDEPRKRFRYFKREQQHLQRFFDRHAFFLNYYRSQATDLDVTFFTLEGGKDSELLTNIVEVQGRWCTPVSYLFAKFIANERLNLVLAQRMSEQLQFGSNLALDQQAFPRMTWTGDSIHLVEIAYGIYLLGEINNGAAGIGAIVRLLESALNVRIGVPSKRWDALSRRTTRSRTHFLDEMKAALVAKMEKEERLG